MDDAYLEEMYEDRTYLEPMDDPDGTGYWDDRDFEEGDDWPDEELEDEDW